MFAKTEKPKLKDLLPDPENHVESSAAEMNADGNAKLQADVEQKEPIANDVKTKTVLNEQVATELHNEPMASDSKSEPVHDENLDKQARKPSVIDEIVSGIKNFLMSDSPTKKQAKLEKTELDIFDELFPLLVDNITECSSKEHDVSPALNWFKKVAEYNVPHGKKNRGMMVCQSLRLLKGSEVTEEELKLARILGWCIEWLQAFFLVQDDVMDQSVTRRGQPCWYKVDKVGLEAINDGMFLESSIYVLLKKYFREFPYYVDLLELFHQTTHQTIMGQCLDMTTSPGPGGEVDFSRFSIERYNSIVKYKTAYYSFYLPVACALYMAGISDDASHAQAKAILLKMGEFFQIQDDYLDCYGEPAVIGKVGTDIEENKCSWLVVQALQRVTDEQKQILQDNYAQQDPQKVAKVKELYMKLGLPKVYQRYEESSYKELMTLINSQCGDLPKEIFVTFANKIYKRKK